jgi:hypothetical protein
MTNIDFINAFDASYRASVTDDRPGDSSGEHVFVGGEERVRDGLLVRVSLQDGTDWRGLFSSGEGKRSGLYAGPGPHTLVVLSNGNAYLVNVLSPDVYSVLDSSMVLGAVPVPAARVLVMYNRETFWGIDRSGIRWKNETGADGVNSLSVDGAFIVGSMCLPWKAETRFGLDSNAGTLLSDAQ